MKTSLRHLLVAAGVVTVTAAFADVVIVAPSAPPAPRYEPIPAARGGFVWNRGHWSWEHGRYVWIGGDWIAERAGHRWVPGAWVAYRGQYRWVPAHWI